MEAEELGKCYHSPKYFINNYCFIYDASAGGWVPFKLWPAQVSALNLIHNNQLSVVLKARQIGLTWLVLAYALWCMIFRPIASISIFSRRDIDAIYLLSEDRLRGMYDRLPQWMRDGHGIHTDNAHEWSMENESTARSFPTSAGDSYTSTLAIVDEADLSPDLNSLLRAVKPTIDNGGKMVLLSRADKDKPISDFKTIYQEATRGKNGWMGIFLPWWVHPNRSEEWYEFQKIDIESRTGSLDDLYEQYPATPEEAMAPRSTDKRIPFQWIQDVYKELEGDDKVGLPGLLVFKRPENSRQYVIGADPAEGNPNSDDSSATILDLMSGEEVGVLTGKFQPGTFAEHIVKLSRFYNNAQILVERNNHGHAVLLQFENDGFEFSLNGYDDKPGWNNNVKGKALMYHHCTEAIHNEKTPIHHSVTSMQLASIVGSTLKAPEHQHDDVATSYALAQCARTLLLLEGVGMGSAAIEGRTINAVQDSFNPVPNTKIKRRVENRSNVRIVRTATRTSHAPISSFK